MERAVKTRTSRKLMILAALGLLLPVGANGQEPVTLTLEEAVELARSNNPDFQATRNDEGAAAWDVRAAYGNFLPSASIGAGASYDAGGQPLLGSFTAEDIGLTETPSYYFSRYNASASWGLSGSTFFNLAQQRANRRAAAANVVSAGVQLETVVKQAYLQALGMRDNVALRRAELERAEENLRLAEARSAAGVAIPLDAKQAQVERGRARVRLLTAEADYATAKLRLLQQIGVEVERDIELVTEFEVFEPSWSQASLIETAEEGHPSLRSLRATASAQRAAARTAWSRYLPTLSVAAGVSGYTRQVGNDDFLVGQAISGLKNQFDACEDFNDLNARLADPYPTRDCSQYVLTDDLRSEIRSDVETRNRSFPFDFTQSPLTVSLNVSLPVFQGFSRQAQIAQADAAADDTEHRLRGERLRLRTDVAAAHLRLRTAYQSVQIEEENRTLGQEQLEQARERYRVGLDSFVQLAEAAALKSQADQAYLAAVYTFHQALADLEAAVGQDLRPGSR